MSAVHALWGGVMDEVQSVSKDQRANVGGGYNFRGVDAVVNAVGPALRKAGVFVVPTSTSILADERANGGKMRNLTIAVTWRVYGPDGDHFDGASGGEAFDAGDKCMAKAHSVAYRTFLLQALCIPTDEPDPDSQGYQREGHSAAYAPAQRPPVAGQIDELLGAIRHAADMDALVTIRGQADARKMLNLPGVTEALDARRAELQA